MRCLLALTLVLPALLADTPSKPQPAPDTFARDAFNHFYNLEYDQALADFESARKLHPNDAEIHNNIAQTLLYREMFRNGALESELVSGNNAFLRRPKLNPSAQTQKRFDDEINQALSLSQARIAKNANDSDALYTLGVTYGLRSNYNFLVRKAWRDALSDATSARKLHNRVTELDPSNYDARLVQGVYDYVVGSLPWTYRTLGFIAGFHGDRDRGIRTLEQVARKGNKNKTDAEVLLCALYRREGRPKDALPLLDDLLRRYPRDYLLLFEKAQMYSSLGNKQEALSALQQLAKLKQENTPGFSRVPWEKIWYEQGNIQFWYNDLDAALDNLKKATAKPDELDLNSGVIAFMRQGQIYDLTNRRDLAKKAYEKAIALAPESEVAKESRRYINDPYQRNKG
jgi:tetratricopeptide (TPR) repeat protein